MKWLGLLFLVSPSGPIPHYEGGSVRILLPKDSPPGKIEIIDADTCRFKKSSETQVDVPQSCGFLQGVYEYSKDEAVGFSVRREGNGHVFLSTPPGKLVRP